MHLGRIRISSICLAVDSLVTVTGAGHFRNFSLQRKGNLTKKFHQIILSSSSEARAVCHETRKQPDATRHYMEQVAVEDYPQLTSSMTRRKHLVDSIHFATCPIISLLIDEIILCVKSPSISFSTN